MASGAQIQFNSADQPVIQFNPADQPVGESKSSDPLGNLSDEEYSKLHPGEQQFRQKMAGWKKDYPAAFSGLSSILETPPGGAEMETGATPAGKLFGAVTNPGRSLAAFEGAMGQAASEVRPALKNFNVMHPFKSLPDAYDALKRVFSAGSKAAGDYDYSVSPKPAYVVPPVERTPVPEATPIPPESGALPSGRRPGGFANQQPETWQKKLDPLIDTSALPVKTPTEDQAAKVIPFSKPQADPEVFAAKNRAPRVQKFADYLESNKVPISDLTQLSTDDPFWGKLGKAVGINAPSKQTVMDTISELLKRQAMQSGGPLANNPAAMKAAMALRDAMNQ